MHRTTPLRVRVFRTPVLILLALALLAPMRAAAAPGKNRRPSPPRAALKQHLSSVSRRIASTRSELRQAKRSEAAIDADLRDIRDRLETTRRRLRDTRSRLGRTRKEQGKVEQALQMSRDRLRAREHLLAQRMAATYRQGPVRYVSVLLGARSMGELVSRAQFLRTIFRYDARLIASIRQDRADVLRWKDQVDQKAREVGQLQTELGARQRDETQDVVRQRAVLSEARARRAELEDDLQALQQDSARITQRLRQIEITPAGKARRMIQFSGGFGRPVAGPVTSGFGSRFHPILHRTRMHTGVDFGAGYGSAIYAAAGGTVVFAGTMRGYGNVVVVDHGGGVSTLYAHCSALLVGEGTTVRQGQNIARVGASGLATGPHLHFEVRRNGVPVNPL